MTILTVDTGSLDSIIAFIIAIVMLLVAWWQNRQKKEAIAVKNECKSTVDTLLAHPTWQNVQEKKIEPEFRLMRNGSPVYQGRDGWYARINPSPEAAALPDDRCYQAVSPTGKFYSGEKDTIYYLLTSDDAEGWRSRNK